MRRCLEFTVALTVLLLAGCTTTARSEATSTSPPISTPLRHKAPPPVVLSAAKGETALPKSLVVKDRFTRSLSVDGGKLLVTPLPPNAFPTVGLSRARRVVAAAQSGEGSAWRTGQLLGLGLVSIDPALTKGLPRYERRPAWVAIVFQSEEKRLAASVSPQPSFEVIVLDAEHGDDVLVYHSAGLGICGPVSCRQVVHRPTVLPATDILSVPWTAVTERPDPYTADRVDWVISYTVPRCASVFDSPGIYWTGEVENSQVDLYVDVEQPMVPQSSCSPAHLVTSVFRPESNLLSAVGHAPLGLGVSGG